MNRLRNLRVSRVDLVDRGAQYDKKTGIGSFIVLTKRDATGEGTRTMETVKDMAYGELTTLAKGLQKTNSRFNNADAIREAVRQRPDLYEEYRNPRSRYQTTETLDREAEKSLELAALDAATWEDVVVRLAKDFSKDFRLGINLVAKNCPEVWSAYLAERNDRARCFQ